MPMTSEYLSPTRLDAVLQALAEHTDAKLLAGGQSLVPMLNLRMSRPQTLIDLSQVAGLDRIEIEDQTLCLGALCRHKDVAASPTVQQAAPLLAAAAGLIGHVQIRNRGTLGGSLVHADPAAEYPVAAVALAAEFVLQSVAGRRTVPAAGFFLAPLVSDIAPDEMLTEVRLPVAAPGTGWSFRELVLPSGAFPLVLVAALVRLDGGGKVAAARLVIGGVAGVPVAVAAAAALVGQTPDARAIAAAATAAAAELEAEDDDRASADYRRTVARVYAEDALIEAVSRARA